MTRHVKPAPGVAPGAGSTNSIADDNAARVVTPDYTPRQSAVDAVLPDHPQARKILVDRIAAEIAPVAIAQARKIYPDLAMNGFDATDTTELDRTQVAAAMLFLHQCDRTSPKRACGGSYGMKHMAEKWGRAVIGVPYISNGALLAAATSLGFQIERYDRGSPNGRIGVASKDLKRLTKPYGWSWP